jgi:histidine triad (HIT) family protein
MTIFTKIVRGEIPCYKVAETDKFLAFLDVFPLVKGHVLVIPKIETDYIFDIESEEYSELFLFAKKVAIALKKSVPCTKVGVSVIGLEVPHAHIHLIPMNQVSDMNFSKQKLSFPQDEMEATATLISSNF